VPMRQVLWILSCSRR